MVTLIFLGQVLCRSATFLWQTRRETEGPSA